MWKNRPPSVYVFSEESRPERSTSRRPANISLWPWRCCRRWHLTTRRTRGRAMGKNSCCRRGGREGHARAYVGVRGGGGLGERLGLSGWRGAWALSCHWIKSCSVTARRRALFQVSTRRWSSTAASGGSSVRRCGSRPKSRIGSSAEPLARKKLVYVVGSERASGGGGIWNSPRKVDTELRGR
jgi:hypothetical protein